jgi:lysophospholipase L1-like esterase
VGDSITFGAGIPDRERNSYPAQLGSLLGPNWEVRNFGVSGATLLKQGDRPYWQERAFRRSLESRPDVVIIKLGTNDSKPDNWRHKDQFLNDCVALIREFQQLETRPRIYLCRPVPAFPERWGIRDDVIHGEIIPLIDQAADRAGVPVIDLYAALEGRAEFFPDLIHPDARGAGVMARVIFTALTGRQAVLDNRTASGRIR